MKKKTIIERQGAKIDEFTAVFEGKEYKYKIQEPTFEQLSAALSVSIGFRNKLDMSGAGKTIFELCCMEYSPEIETNSKLLISICVNLYTEYVLPVEVEIKKN